MSNSPKPFIQDQLRFAREHYLLKGEFDKGIEFFDNLSQEMPETLEVYFYLGASYLLQGDGDLAEEIWISVLLFENSLSFEQLQSELIKFLEGLFLDYFNQNQFIEAKILLNAIHSLNENYINLDLKQIVVLRLKELCEEGINAAQLGNYTEAEKIFQKILIIDDQDEQTWQNLLLSRIELQQWQSAYDVALKLIEFDNQNPDYYFVIGEIRFQGKDYINAKKAYRAALKLHHSDPRSIYYHIFECYSGLGNHRAAERVAKIGKRKYPGDPLFLHLYQSVVPIVYQSKEEIKFYRKKFAVLLRQYIDEAEKKIDDHEQGMRVAQSHFISNFYLSYQGFNDKRLLSDTGRLSITIVDKVFKFNHNKIVDSLPNKNNSKIKVGYISARVRHPLAILSEGWLKNANKDEFEIYVYDLNTENTDEAKIIYDLKKFADYYYKLPEKIEAVVQQVLGDQLDILVFPDIGIEAFTYLVASFRLAPIQCTTWTHPITSGLPTIDYFLSSDLMEPPNADIHYTEKLIRLPNLGVSVSPLQIPDVPIKLSNLDIPSNKILYACFQATQKYLPQFDYIFPEIAKRNPKALFLFIESPNSRAYCGRILIKRLIKVFAEYDLSFDDYCQVLPRIPHDQYLAVMRLMDIFLDTFGWSGGITTLNAITCDLPVVTCPGKLMRSRHSYGILKMLGVEDTIAETENQYVEIAAELGLNHDYRHNIRQKIKANKHKAFEDRECIIALEKFFKSVAHRTSN